MSESAKSLLHENLDGAHLIANRADLLILIIPEQFVCSADDFAMLLPRADLQVLHEG